MTYPILVAIGANLTAPDGAPPLLTCQRSAVMLDALAGLRLIALSTWHVTRPVPVSDQPDYLNGVALLRARVEPDPAALLSALHGIEAAFGRRRSVPNAARTLDLDLIAMGGLIRSAPDPILPHPRAHLRHFVLAPLVEVAPVWVHPVLGLQACELLRRLPPD